MRGPCTQCYTIAISNVASCNTLAYNNVMKRKCVRMYMCLLRVEISTRRSAIAELQQCVLSRTPYSASTTIVTYNSCVCVCVCVCVTVTVTGLVTYLCMMILLHYGHNV